MNVLRLVTLALIALLIEVSAAEEISPGFMYRGPLLDVQSPHSEGWVLLDTSSQGMAFARAGDEKGSSFGAQVLPFDLPNPSGQEDFVDLIKQAVKQDTSGKRFTVVEESYDYTNERGYPCVRTAIVVEDKKAKVSMFKKMRMMLQTYSLYCRHPKKENFGFAAIYSYRGPQIIDALENEAASFIEGIQVPDD
jgi:hypothetical protein